MKINRAKKTSYTHMLLPLMAAFGSIALIAVMVISFCLVAPNAIEKINERMNAVTAGLEVVK